VPTGASGQVTHIDLDRLEQTLQPAEGETRIKIIGLRRVIAERMQAAKRHIPHFTYVDEIDVTDLEALRRRANENARQIKSGAGKPKLTVLPFIIRALGLTLKDWPQFNARYMDEQGFVSQFAALNLGLATMTDKGLIVPVIKDAGRKSIWQLARDIARLSEAARGNTLSADALTGASTTLTSLGPLGGIVTTGFKKAPGKSRSYVFIRSFSRKRKGPRLAEKAAPPRDAAFLHLRRGPTVPPRTNYLSINTRVAGYGVVMPALPSAVRICCGTE